jgi:hypothetical protein
LTFDVMLMANSVSHTVVVSFRLFFLVFSPLQNMIKHGK